MVKVVKEQSKPDGKREVVCLHETEREVDAWQWLADNQEDHPEKLRLDFEY